MFGRVPQEWLRTGPILNLERGNARELGKIVGYEREAISQANGSDEEIVRSDRLACDLKRMAQRPVHFCRYIVEWKRRVRAQKMRQHLQPSRPIPISLCSVQQLRFDN